MMALKCSPAMPTNPTKGARTRIKVISSRVPMLQFLIDSIRTYIRDCEPDRKSTRLNSSHHSISYAVFCLKKKKNTTASVKFINRRWLSRGDELVDMGK